MTAKVGFRFLVFSLFFLFSFWLMTFTFGSNSDRSEIRMAGRVASDFSAHLPLVRSFSLGDNFWPTYDPLFGGEKYNYYYGFYFLVGWLERIGLPIGWAMNIPSILSFFVLLGLIYLLASRLFKSEMVGLLSVVFFLFNSSLSFLEFFKTHPILSKTLLEIVSNREFSSFGPWDGKVVSAFWNLNIYTNQRHLPLAFATTLLVVLTILRGRLSFWSTLGLYLILSLLPLFHLVGFAAVLIFLAVFFVLAPSRRPLILKISAILPVSFLVYFFLVKSPGFFSPKINPRYLIDDSLTAVSLARYWFYNLGLSFFTIPLGFALSSRLAKKVLISIFPVVLIGHLVQLSPEMAANHKFFNLFVIFGNMYSAYFFYRIFRVSLPFLLQVIKHVFLALLIVLMTLSGIIDFFPIKNDAVGEMLDYPKNETINWIVTRTPKRSIFLNNNFINNPASLAGRPVFMGWPYFPWSRGYDSNTRWKVMEDFLNPKDKTLLCRGLKLNSISYIIINNQFSDLTTNKSFFIDNFRRVFGSEDQDFMIFSADGSCF